MEAAVFIPTDESKGVEILTALLQAYPLIATEEAAEEAETQADDEDRFVMTVNEDGVIDLSEWIVPIVEADSAAGQEQNAQPQTVPETSSAPTQSGTPTDSPEPVSQWNAGMQPSLFTVPEAPTPARRTRQSIRERLGQLAFNFGDEEAHDAEERTAFSQAA